MKKNSFLLDLLLFSFLPTTITFSQNSIIAGFAAPDNACVNSPVHIQNTSSGASNYYWSFCAADFNSTPEAVNLGNPNGQLSAPVFSSFAMDDNGNYYVLTVNHNPGQLIRLNFGNSLLNSPTAEGLGDFNGIIPNQAEGIQLLRVNAGWYAIIVGGGNQLPNSSPRIVRIAFGNSLANTPVATNWGNIGGLNLPHDLFISQEAGNYYGFAINVNDNTLTRLNFGADFTNMPTGINLGNIGNLNYPAGFTFVKYNQNWFAFVANRITSSLTRLSFGSSLLNVPTGINIGNPGATLDFPRDISLFIVCDGIYGFVVNEQSNDVIKLNFGFDPTSSPQSTNLGNLGNLDFPHSISDFFRVGNDIYAFIQNVNNNTLTRIRFAGCQNLPGSDQQNPPDITYTQAGVYNINLLVDLGLPTQASFCKQINVNPLPQGQFTGETICKSNNPGLLFTATGDSPPFTIQYSNGTNNYMQSNLNNNTSFNVPNQLADTTAFILKSITDSKGCTNSGNLDTAVVIINPLPQGEFGGESICKGENGILSLKITQGKGPVNISYGDGVKIYYAGMNNSLYYNNFISAPYPIIDTTKFTLLSITDSNGCIRTNGFTSPDAIIAVKASPQIQFDSIPGVCLDKPPFQVTEAKEISGILGTGGFTGRGIDTNGVFLASAAGVGNRIITYSYTANNGCKSYKDQDIIVNPLPVANAGPDLIACVNSSIQLNATGGETYLWSPPAGLSNPAIANPVLTTNTTTIYSVAVTNAQGCTAFDSVKITFSSAAKAYYKVPNAFTPNGDGKNDCFGIQKWGGVELKEFSVYNRWGELVFSTKNPSQCWDGTFKGNPQDTGGFVYVIRAKTNCGDINLEGTVMLIR